MELVKQVYRFLITLMIVSTWIVLCTIYHQVSEENIQIEQWIGVIIINMIYLLNMIQED